MSESILQLWYSKYFCIYQKIGKKRKVERVKKHANFVISSIQYTCASVGGIMFSWKMKFKETVISSLCQIAYILINFFGIVDILANQPS